MSTTFHRAEPISQPIPVAQPKAGAAVFVWGVWAVMLVAALGFVGYFSTNTPFGEDWYMAPAVAGAQPLSLRFLWKQDNEHRHPLAKLVFYSLYRLTNDFRTGKFFNVLFLGAAAFALIWGARSLRGWTSYTDAFFPAVLLHWGPGQTLLNGYYVLCILPPLLGIALLLIVVRSGTQLTPRAAVLAGICLALLPLCGGHGLPYVPPFTLWLVYVGVRRWRSAEPGSKRDALIILGSTLVAVLLTGLYFRRYQFASGGGSYSVGLWPKLKTALMFSSMGFGPAGEWLWPVSGLIVLILFLASAAVLVHVWRSRPAEHPRTLGLSLFLGTMALFALAVGWNRSGGLEGWNVGFARHYITLSVPLLCCIYLIWGVYGSPTGGRYMQMLMFALACAVLPLNCWDGLVQAKAMSRQTRALERDLLAGLPPFMLAGRYTPGYFLDEPQTMLPMMRDGGVGAFRFMGKDPPFSEVPLPVAPAAQNQMEWVWENGIGRATGTGYQSYVDFALPEPRFVAGVRVKFKYIETSTEVSGIPWGEAHVFWKRSDQEDFPPVIRKHRALAVFDVDEQRCVTYLDRKGRQEVTLTIWMGDTVDRLRICPDIRPCTFQISEIVLLVPPADWQVPSSP